MSSKDPDQEQSKQPPLSRAAVGEQFLEAFIERTSADASGFLDRLTQQTQEAMGQRTTMQVPFNVRDGFLEQSMSKWMDKLFNFFENYKLKFNQGAISEDLRVSCQRPEASREVISYNAYREPDKTALLYRGSLSTQKWTVLIRGTKEKIDVYLVPAERALTITRTQEVYSPIMTLVSVWEKGHVSWSKNQQPVAEAQLDEIAQSIFAELVKYATGRQPDAPKPESSLPPSPTIRGKDDNPYLRDFLASEAASHRQLQTSVREPSEAASSAAPATKDYSIVELCDLLLEAVDIEIEKTAQSGTDAFSQLNTEGAQAALKQVETLKQFRNQVSDLIGSWKALQTP